ncbi:Protein C04F6.7 [Aphelenchoides avenae]|nr:Protein C04F6.7 [Aphelenchus avenae]
MAAEEVSLPSEEAETVSVAAEEISQAPEEINFAAYSNAFSGDHGTKLADSGLTAGWLFETLLNNSWEFHDALGSGNVEEISAVDISEGEGYASKVYRVKLRLGRANAEQFNVIMKVPTMEKIENLMRDTSLNDSDRNMAEAEQAAFDAHTVHDVECAFYEACGQIEDFPLPIVWFIRKIGGIEPGVILMEDFGQVECKLRHFRPLNVQQIRNIVRHYAAFHAHQLCLDDEAKAKWEAIPVQNDVLLSIGEKMMPKCLVKVKECEEEWLKELLHKMEPIMTKEFAEFALIRRPKELGVPLVHCQGDSGSYNIFFKKASDGTPSNEVCAFVDWQMVIKASPMFDIGRIVMAFTDAEERRELDESLVEEYYDYLKTAVEKKGKNLTFGIEELHELYELAKVNASYMTLGTLPYMNIILKDRDSPAVIEALRAKQPVRVKLSLEDAIKALRKYAPQFLND